MIDSKQVTELFRRLGADLCGVAGVDRFEDAPKGYHPKDVFPACRSVVSFGCRFPAATLLCSSHVPYTRVRNSITAKMDAMALDFCIEMEKRSVACVPVPTNESLWDPQTGRWRSIVSLKHAAQAAGLGAIGRHSLLITPEFGSMVWLGAVLVDAPLDPDPMLDNPCTNCGACVQVCPVHALDEPLLCQQACWDHAFGNDPEHRNWHISCHRCRDVCPYNLGSQNSFLQK